ncbi:MAG TPA: TetR/AcrR family transcriptional regulator [Candidatus Binataceae bacterium]|nr:TetR/AcrR family transcriptional regulator [Candidatus Binataceae bacterium]
MPRIAADKREQHTEARCEQILHAALLLFARKGFAETTMEEVAAEANLAKGSLYLYFPSKDALLEQLLRGNLLLPGGTELLASLRYLPARTAIPKLVLTLWRTLKERKPITRLVVREILSRPDRARLYLEQVRLPALRALAECLGHWMDRGELRRGDPMVASQCLFGMLWYLIQSQEFLGEGDEGPSDETIEQMVATIFLDGAAARESQAPGKHQ